MTFTTVNPATGEKIKDYEPDGDPQVDRKLTAAKESADEWRRTPVEARVAALSPIVAGLQEGREDLAGVATTEMGKPITQARAEVDKTIRGVQWFLDTATSALSPDIRDSDEPSTRVQHRALGVVLGIMPWNFPYWQVLRSVVPALLAGNAYLLKPSPVTTGSGLAVRDLLQACGLPTGLHDTLLIDTDAIARTIRDDRIAAVTLTGSVGAGRAVAEAAGAALKPCTLELGGSDPFVVLADADLDHAARTATQARMQNTGQSCLAAKRFIVDTTIAEGFLDAVKTHTEALVVGDPHDPDSEIGPLASSATRDSIHQQVQRSIEAGATRYFGAMPEDGPGFYYQPGALTDVEPNHPAGCEELFGPVATIQVADNPDDAIRRAAATPFGLGATIWTEDRDAIDRFIDTVRAGTVAINQMTRSDPRFPFGGFGHSGYGRELAQEGLLEFTGTVTIYDEQ